MRHGEEKLSDKIAKFPKERIVKLFEMTTKKKFKEKHVINALIRVQRCEAHLWL